MLRIHVAGVRIEFPYHWRNLFADPDLLDEFFRRAIFPSIPLRRLQADQLRTRFLRRKGEFSVGGRNRHLRLCGCIQNRRKNEDQHFECGWRSSPHQWAPVTNMSRYRLLLEIES